MGQFHLKQLEPTHIPVDLIKIRSWTLLHQPLYHTYGHHDASGLATWTRVLSGHKFWVAIRTHGYGACETREEINNHNERYHYPDENGQGVYGYSDKSDRCCVVAEKGDVM